MSIASSTAADEAADGAQADSEDAKDAANQPMVSQMVEVCE